MEGVFRFRSWFLNARGLYTVGLIIGILRYVFHNFIIIYYPFCFRKRVEIFFPVMFLVTFSVICFNLRFPVMGVGGGGGLLFFS